MSKYEWESAEITLPSAGVTPMKRALREVQNLMHEEARRLSAEFWNQHAKRTRSTARYLEALDAYLYRSPTVRNQMQRFVLDEGLDYLLREAAKRPHMLTLADINTHFPKATSKTDSFSFYDTTISISGRTLRWSIGENNRAVSHDSAHPVFRAMMRQLSRVQWTRGTGGRSWGSNEYAEDAAREHGYDPVSTTQVWGPLGKAHEEAERRAWMAAAGFGPRGGRPRR